MVSEILRVNLASSLLESSTQPYFSGGVQENRANVKSELFHLEYVWCRRKVVLSFSSHDKCPLYQAGYAVIYLFIPLVCVHLLFSGNALTLSQLSGQPGHAAATSAGVQRWRMLDAALIARRLSSIFLNRCSHNWIITRVQVPGNRLWSVYPDADSFIWTKWRVATIFFLPYKQITNDSKIGEFKLLKWNVHYRKNCSKNLQTTTLILSTIVFGIFGNKLFLTLAEWNKWAPLIHYGIILMKKHLKYKVK